MAVGAAVATPGGSLSQPARNKTARGIVSFWKPSRGLARRTGKPAGTQASAGTLNQEGYLRIAEAQMRTDIESGVQHAASGTE